LSGVETEAPLTPDFPQRATWIPSPTLALFSIAIFVGSGLVFLIEPMVGKMLLPLFGGTPAVWAVTLVFFQSFLLAGYAYAHVSIRLLGIRRQALVQLGLLVVPLALLPIAVPRGLHPSTEHPAIWLLGVLFLTAALPFFVVSSASPVLQRWFSTSGDAASRDPYFLYAASNAGSLLGLLAYPMLLEPRLTLAQQSRVWTVVYVVFAALTALCVLRLLATSGGPIVASPRVRVVSLTWRRRLRWIGMAALPSSLMLGTTSYITTDIGSFPLLWVLPLAAYLVSFILAFARRQLLSLTVVSRAIVVTATLVAASLLHLAVLPIWALVGVHTLNLFFVALLVHRLLAMERPPTEHLTEYYLLLSVGGVCGGIFNALVAPVAFSTILEYPIVIVVALALRPGPRGPRADARFFKKTTDLVLPLAIAGGVIVALIALNVAGWLTALTYAATLAVALMAVVLLVRRPVRFAAGIAALVLIPVLLGSKALHTERTFFGVLKVESGDRTHRFVHGTTLHGVENFTPGWRDEPLSYYSRQGPIGQVFQRLGDRIHSVGAIGLGAGTIAAYGKSGDRFTFYEIDAAVARIASNPRYFTFLHDSKADIRVVIGDGRLRIADAPRRAYDLIVLDAFSSDAVPVHLLTREAVGLYLSKLRPDGLLAFHISSNYLDLRPVIAGIARALDASALTQEHRPPARQERMGADRSIWVVVTPDSRSLATLRSDPRWKPLDESTTVWTDQFSNILSVAKWLD
jgi:hypothetical protein